MKKLPEDIRIKNISPDEVAEFVHEILSIVKHLDEVEHWTLKTTLAVGEKLAKRLTKRLMGKTIQSITLNKEEYLCIMAMNELAGGFILTKLVAVIHPKIC